MKKITQGKSLSRAEKHRETLYTQPTTLYRPNEHTEQRQSPRQCVCVHVARLCDVTLVIAKIRPARWPSRERSLSSAVAKMDENVMWGVVGLRRNAWLCRATRMGGCIGVSRSRNASVDDTSANSTRANSGEPAPGALYRDPVRASPINLDSLLFAIFPSQFGPLFSLPSKRWPFFSLHWIVHWIWILFFFFLQLVEIFSSSDLRNIARSRF